MQSHSGEGIHTLLKRVSLIGATLVVVASLAFVLVMALAPQALPVGYIRDLLTPQPTLAPINNLVNEDQQPGNLPAPAFSYATPVYIEANNHSACNAQKIELPFSGSQSASHEYNIYRFFTRTPALRNTISNYNNVGEVLIYEIIEDACSTTGRMSVRFVTSTELKSSNMDADIVEGLSAGANYLLAIHTRGRLNSGVYSLVVNEIEARALTGTVQTTAMPAGIARGGKTASATSTSMPSPTPPPLPDAAFPIANTPAALSTQPIQVPVQPSDLPTSAPIPLLAAATATTRLPVVATQVIVLPTSVPAVQAMPTNSSSEPTNTPKHPAPAPTIAAPSTTVPPPPKYEPKPTKEPKHPAPEPTVAAPTAPPPVNPPEPPIVEPSTAVPSTAEPPIAELPTAEPPTDPPKHPPKEPKPPKDPKP